MKKRKKITPKQRILMQLSVGDTHTESRCFENPEDLARAQSALSQSVYRMMRRAKDYGDDFEVRIYSAMGKDGYAVFAVISKVEIGAENPFFKNSSSSGFTIDDL